MKELEILQISIKDYFTKPFLRILTYPLLGSLLVLYISFFTITNLGLDSLENVQIEINEHQTQIQNGVIDESSTTQTYTGNSIIDFLLKHTLTSWIVSFLVYSVGLFAIGYLSIFISLLIIGLLTPKILSMIHKKHYNETKISSYGTISNSIMKLLKSLFMMVIIFLLLMPLYFIPIINIIAINIPFFYFFHKMLHFDVSSTILSYNDYLKIYHNNIYMMRSRSLLLYVLSLIPFVAFFISVFYIIYLGHVYFKELNSLQVINHSQTS